MLRWTISVDNPIRLHWLDPRDPEQPFPPPHTAMRDPNGLLAIGGDLCPARLLRAYAGGIFPWYNPNEPILWWCPDPRAVLLPAAFKVSRSLQKAVKRNYYAVTLDGDFAAVLEACGGPRRGGQGTWLGPDMKRAYLELHALGYAHSVEVWRQGSLIGGLYGIAVGGVFFGESMFSRATDASKLALHWLCRQLADWEFGMIDCQIASPHLASLGAVEIGRERFLAQLRAAATAPARTGLWRFDLADVPASRTHRPAGLHWPFVEHAP